MNNKQSLLYARDPCYKILWYIIIIHSRSYSTKVSESADIALFNHVSLYVVLTVVTSNKVPSSETKESPFAGPRTHVEPSNGFW